MMAMGYTDSPSAISYEYLDRIPDKKLARNRVNLSALVCIVFIEMLFMILINKSLI